jgi:hypothetical protein
MDVGTKWTIERTLGLIAAACLCLALITPVQAQSDTSNAGKPLSLDQYFKQRTHKIKKTAVVPKSKLASATPHPAMKADNHQDTAALPTSLPDSVANANARLTIGDIDQSAPVKAVADGVADASSPPMEIVSGVQIASADQLNDIDRAAMDDMPGPQVALLTPSAAEPAVTITPQVPLLAIMSVSNAEEARLRATLIAKIMVAFGLMLMACSAIRLMFV